MDECDPHQNHDGYHQLDTEELKCYLQTRRCITEMASYLKLNDATSEDENTVVREGICHQHHLSKTEYILPQSSALNGNVVTVSTVLDGAPSKNNIGSDSCSVSSATEHKTEDAGRGSEHSNGYHHPIDTDSASRMINSININSCTIAVDKGDSQGDRYNIESYSPHNRQSHFEPTNTKIDNSASSNTQQQLLQKCILSRPMQRKLLSLDLCQLVEEEGRSKVARIARSLGERMVSELLVLHQFPHQLSSNLWAAVRTRGCQFLGPAMQEEVLKLILITLENGSLLSRKVLVSFVVQKLEVHYPQASKTAIGHVVQLLYRASCFKVFKRDGESSLMQLKEEFRQYDALRREHDSQIVQIALEAGLRISPEQWSSLLYGDVAHKPHMQSIIDKHQSPQSFVTNISELMLMLHKNFEDSPLLRLRPHLEFLASVDPSPDAPTLSWSNLEAVIRSLSSVMTAFVECQSKHSSNIKPSENVGHEIGQGDAYSSTESCDGSSVNVAVYGNMRYKTSMCRDFAAKGNCPRGSSCSFAHSQTELEKYRLRSRKQGLRVSPSHRQVPCQNNSPGQDKADTTLGSWVTDQQKNVQEMGLDKDTTGGNNIDHVSISRQSLRQGLVGGAAVNTKVFQPRVPIDSSLVPPTDGFMSVFKTSDLSPAAVRGRHPGSTSTQLTFSRPSLDNIHEPHKASPTQQISLHPNHPPPGFPAYQHQVQPLRIPTHPPPVLDSSKDAHAGYSNPNTFVNQPQIVNDGGPNPLLLVNNPAPPPPSLSHQVYLGGVGEVTTISPGNVLAPCVGGSMPQGQQPQPNDILKGYSCQEESLQDLCLRRQGIIQHMKADPVFLSSQHPMLYQADSERGGFDSLATVIQHNKRAQEPVPKPVSDMFVAARSTRSLDKMANKLVTYKQQLPFDDNAKQVAAARQMVSEDHSNYLPVSGTSLPGLSASVSHSFATVRHPEHASALARSPASMRTNNQLSLPNSSKSSTVMMPNSNPTRSLPHAFAAVSQPMASLGKSADNFYQSSTSFSYTSSYNDSILGVSSDINSVNYNTYTDRISCDRDMNVTTINNCGRSSSIDVYNSPEVSRVLGLQAATKSVADVVCPSLNVIGNDVSTTNARSSCGVYAPPEVSRVLCLQDVTTTAANVVSPSLNVSTTNARNSCSVYAPPEVSRVLGRQVASKTSSDVIYSSLASSTTYRTTNNDYPVLYNSLSTSEMQPFESSSGASEFCSFPVDDSDDSQIPFEQVTVSKFGPISRVNKSRSLEMNTTLVQVTADSLQPIPPSSSHLGYGNNIAHSHNHPDDLKYLISRERTNSCNAPPQMLVGNPAVKPSPVQKHSVWDESPAPSYYNIAQLMTGAAEAVTNNEKLAYQLQAVELEISMKTGRQPEPVRKIIQEAVGLSPSSLVPDLDRTYCTDASKVTANNGGVDWEKHCVMKHFPA